ncbi:STS1 [Candida theae]|uniref:Tethering factor for nuclear proteasome STS1 n=1 Tax=Candida theae TaxID=1198502 RepID=A0AAD5BD35_9ASCO|nr:STS1 [Candida theae]KAI5955479.1 STS1 [Candida theae]
MMSAGFQWGINNNPKTGDKLDTCHHQTSSSHQLHTPRSVAESSVTRKRKRLDEGETNGEDDIVENGKQDSKPDKSSILLNNRKQFNFTSSTNISSHRPKNTPTLTSRSTTPAAALSSRNYKRSKTPRIIGQPLPPTRIIETLAKPEMTKLLYSLLDIHPELNQTITRIAQPPSIQSILSILSNKLDTIINSLPYKCDSSSDYSYLRIKPYLVDFLNCLEDYILWILPPNQHDYDLVSSLWFLHESTNLIHKLPNFTNSEFQYTRNLTYETIINCWIILFNQDLANDDIYQIFQKRKHPSNQGGHYHDDDDNDNDEDEDELIEKLRVHERYCSKFGQLIEIYQEKLHQYKHAMQEQYSDGVVAATGGAGGGAVGTDHHLNGDGTVAANSRLNEFVTVDYSQYSLGNPYR